MTVSGAVPSPAWLAYCAGACLSMSVAHEWAPWALPGLAGLWFGLWFNFRFIGLLLGLTEPRPLTREWADQWQVKLQEDAIRRLGEETRKLREERDDALNRAASYAWSNSPRRIVPYCGRCRCTVEVGHSCPPEPEPEPSP